MCVIMCFPDPPVEKSFWAQSRSETCWFSLNICSVCLTLTLYPRKLNKPTKLTNFQVHKARSRVDTLPHSRSPISPLSRPLDLSFSTLHFSFSLLWSSFFPISGLWFSLHWYSFSISIGYRHISILEDFKAT